MTNKFATRAKAGRKKVPSPKVAEPAGRFRQRAGPYPARVGFWALVSCGCLLGTGSTAAGAAEPDIRRDAVVAAIEKVMPSVVNIATETVIEYHEWYDELLRQFYGWSRAPLRQKSISLGSGVIIDEDGYILTNFHVVRRASRIQVKLWDGRELEAEALVATASSDVALIKLRAAPGEKFKAIRFAPDDDLLLGETVMALGNPYGLGASVTKGILSSKNRRPSTGTEPLNVEDWLQTDAAINPGNSGGPLVNLRGELIGLNVAVYREEHGERGLGVGFSLPVKQVSAALSRLFTPEGIYSLWFGAQFKVGPGTLLVSAVQTGSPAARAGLRVDDQVLQVNGQKPEGVMACARVVGSAPDRVANFAIRRGNEQRTIKVKLTPFEEIIPQKLGLTLLELTAQTAERLGIRAGQGLYVEEVERAGPGDRAQLQRGYLVSSIEGQPAADLRTVAGVLAGKTRGETVRLGVIVPRRIGANFLEFRQGVAEVQLR